MKKPISFSLFVLFVFLCSIVGGIFGSEIVGPLLIKRPIFLKYNLPPSPVYVIEKKEIKVEEESALKVKKIIQEQEKNLIDNLSQSLVLVLAQTKKGKILAPGIVLASGLESQILTFAQKAKEIEVLVKEKKLKAQVLKSDENFLLLKVEEKNLKTVPFFEFEKLKVGQRFFFLSKTEKGLVLDEGLVSSFDQNSIFTNLKIKEPGFLFSEEGKLLGAAKLDEKKGMIVFPSPLIENFFKK